MSATFMITVDLLDPTADADAFKTFIKTSTLFKEWWNHIPGVFLVTSDSDAATISGEVRRLTKNARLLVAEVELAKSDGLLPKSAWDWIDHRTEHQDNLVAVGPRG